MLRLTPPWVLFGRVNLLTLLPSLSKIGQQHRVVVVRKSFFFFYGPKFFFDPITSADVRAAHPLPRPPSCCFVDMFPITVDMIADKILWVGKLHNLSTPSYLLKLSHWFPVKFFFMSLHQYDWLHSHTYRICACHFFLFLFPFPFLLHTTMGKLERVELEVIWEKRDKKKLVFCLCQNG
jgi:hypothetical protein